MKRILLTGMSGTGKSTVIVELVSRGYKAIDLDRDEFSEWVSIDPDSDPLTPEPGKDWVWREERVQQLLSMEDTDILFVSGCAENMRLFFPQFDHVILLSASPEIITERLVTRTNNSFGKQPDQLARVLTLQQTVEPLLRKAATHEIDTSAPLDDVAGKVLRIALEG